MIQNFSPVNLKYHQSQKVFNRFGISLLHSFERITLINEIHIHYKIMFFLIKLFCSTFHDTQIPDFKLRSFSQSRFELASWDGFSKRDYVKEGQNFLTTRCRKISLTMCPSVSLSICLFLHLTVCPSICLSIYLFVLPSYMYDILLIFVWLILLSDLLLLLSYSY